MAEGQAFFDVWMQEHARCETCRYVQRDLFGLVCGQSEERTEPGQTCKTWLPFADFALAFDAVVEKSLKMDMEHGGYLHA